MSRKRALIAVLLSVLTVLTLSGSTFALRGKEEDLMKIALAQGIRKCYKAGDDYIKSSGIKKSDFESSTGGIKTLLGTNQGGLVFIPTEVGNTITNSSESGVSCSDVISGRHQLASSDSMKGFTTYYGAPFLLEKYGYAPADGSSVNTKKEQVRIKIDVKDATGHNTTAVKITESANDGLYCKGDRYSETSLGKTKYIWKNFTCAGKIDVKYEKDGKDITYFIESDNTYISTRITGEINQVQTYKTADFQSLFTTLEATNANDTLKTAFEKTNFANMVEANARIAFGSVYDDPKATVTLEYKLLSTESEPEYKFISSNREETASIAVAGISKGAKDDYYTVEKKTINGNEYEVSTASWSDPYIYNLYYHYLGWAMNSSYKVKVTNCGASKPDGANYLFKNKTDQWCKVEIPSGAEGVLDEAKSVVKSGELAKGKFKDILDWFNNQENYNNLAENDFAKAPVDENGEITNTGTQGPQTGTGNKKSEQCYDYAGALGWVVCPLIHATQSFIVRQYGQWVEPALKMDTVLFQAGNARTNGTYRAWDIFRNVANFFFIVLFIFVIFSQVTGIGIDNYGVKKAIPKLIIAGIMINLSFVICQGAIDVSNITGQGVGGMFQWITSEVEYPEAIQIDGVTINATDEGSWQDTATWGDSYHQNWLGNSILIAIVCALGAGTLYFKGLAFIIPILALMISVAFAVLGLVAILGIRQAAAVLLVAVSPLAFVCYILPNTKTMFDKWFNAFKGLLVAFPACSALVYGGDMAGTILLKAANGNMWVVISAAAISIAPVFIIPKVIKGSLGAISGGIANLSGKLGGYAKGKARSRMDQSFLARRKNYTDFMRNQKRAAKTSTYNAKRGQKTISRYAKRHKDPSNMNAVQRRKYNVAMSAVNAANQDATNAFASSNVGKSPQKIEEELLKSANSKNKITGKTSLDANQLVAGLSSIVDEDALTSTLTKLSQTDGYRQLMSSDPALNSRIADVMRGRKNSIINQSIGKLMAQGKSVDEIFADNKKLLREKVQGAGASVMASQDKDVFGTEGAADLFSNDQIRAGLTAGYTGSTAKKFFDMMQSANIQGRKEEIVKGLTAEDITNMNMTTMVVNQKNPDTDQMEQVEKEVGAFAALGGGSMEAGAAYIRDTNPEAIDSLNSDDGKPLRSRMNKDVKKALHVKNDGGSEDDDKNKNPGGSGSISGGITVSDMSEDDFRYVQWQHDRNPGPGAGSSDGGGGGGSPAPSGGGSSAQGGSPAGGDDQSLNIDHSNPAPNAPDLNSINDNGSVRDSNGNYVRTRQDEGNRFDYHPILKGESAKDYSDRTKYEKALEAYGNANPKQADETSSDYYKRIKAPSFDEWKKSGMGEILTPAERDKAAKVNDPTREPKPLTPDEPAPIEIPHDSKPETSSVIDLPGPKPNPDARIDLLEPKPNPDAHFDTLEPKPNPDARIDLLEPKPNPDARIDLLEPKPNPDARIDTLEPKPNPDARIDLPDYIEHLSAKVESAPIPEPAHESPIELPNDKPSQDAHIELPGDKPNPDTRIELPGEKPNPDARIDLPQSVTESMQTEKMQKDLFNNSYDQLGSLRKATEGSKSLTESVANIHETIKTLNDAQTMDAGKRQEALAASNKAIEELNKRIVSAGLPGQLKSQLLEQSKSLSKTINAIPNVKPKPANPGAHIDIPGPKPNPNAHFDTLEPKPGDFSRFDTSAPKFDANRHLDVPGGSHPSITTNHHH
ncbi:hypothetical protein IJM16_03570 [Candidatus Saccharibacteria bacterium]|nr:hypothetical protein [Candidatus Saccharibacteria bacterium]